MKLVDLQKDLTEVAQFLTNKYLVVVDASLKNNPDNLTEMFLTFKLKTTEKVAPPKETAEEVAQLETNAVSEMNAKDETIS